MEWMKVDVLKNAQFNSFAIIPVLLNRQKAPDESARRKNPFYALPALRCR